MSEIAFARIEEIAQETREVLAQKSRWPYGKIAGAYMEYLVSTGRKPESKNGIEVGSREFLAGALRKFPHQTEAIASSYLRYRLEQEAKMLPSEERQTVTEIAWRPEVWHHGSYNGVRHTYVLLGGLAIADITADQHGGPEVYVGPLEEPWRLWHDLA